MNKPNYIKEIKKNLLTSELELEKNRKNKSEDYEIENYCLFAKIKFLREKLIMQQQ